MRIATRVGGPPVRLRCDVDCGFLIRRAVYREVTKGSTFARPLGVVCAGWVFEGCRREELYVCGVCDRKRLQVRWGNNLFTRGGGVLHDVLYYRFLDRLRLPI